MSPHDDISATKGELGYIFFYSKQFEDVVSGLNEYMGLVIFYK